MNSCYCIGCVLFSLYFFLEQEGEKIAEKYVKIMIIKKKDKSTHIIKVNGAENQLFRWAGRSNDCSDVTFEPANDQ